MLVTGIKELDELLGFIPKNWIVEFYGERKVVKLLLHRAIVLNSKDGIILAYTQEFSGLDPYLLTKFSKVLGRRLHKEKVVISRAFKVEDVFEVLSKAVSSGFKRIFVIDPYLHIPADPARYVVASKITAKFKEATLLGKEVAIFNRVSKLGMWRPDGGSYHHHAVHVIVRLDPMRHGIKATLIKHPLKRESSVVFPYVALTRGGVSWGGQRQLLEWL